MYIVLATSPKEEHVNKAPRYKKQTVSQLSVVRYNINEYRGL